MTNNSSDCATFCHCFEKNTRTNKTIVPAAPLLFKPCDNLFEKDRAGLKSYLNKALAA